MHNIISNNFKGLVERGQKYHWMYGNKLASHLPMALIALDKLSASSTQLNDFYNNNIKKWNCAQTPI